MTDSFHYESIDTDVIIGPESQLREDLADAMKDCAIVPVGRDSGERQSFDKISLFDFSFAVRLSLNYNFNKCTQASVKT